MIGPGPRNRRHGSRKADGVVGLEPLRQGRACLAVSWASRCGTVPSGAFVCTVPDRKPVAKLSAGLLLYRRSADGIQVLIAHPGGPIWARRDAGAWSLPKGALDDGEDLLAAARREFEEETGERPPDGDAIDLGEVRMRSGKIVHAFALEGDLDPTRIRSMTVEVEWPPRSGRMIRVPEIDRVLWAGPAEARTAPQPGPGDVRAIACWRPWRGGYGRGHGYPSPVSRRI